MTCHGKQVPPSTSMSGLASTLSASWNPYKTGGGAGQFVPSPGTRVVARPGREGARCFDQAAPLPRRWSP